MIPSGRNYEGATLAISSVGSQTAASPQSQAHSGLQVKVRSPLLSSGSFLWKAERIHAQLHVLSLCLTVFLTWNRAVSALQTCGVFPKIIQEKTFVKWMNQNDTALLKSYLGETPHQIKATFVTTPPRSFLFARGLYFKKFIKISKDKCISVQDKNQPPPHASLFLSMYCSDFVKGS